MKSETIETIQAWCAVVGIAAATVAGCLAASILGVIGGLALVVLAPIFAIAKIVATIYRHEKESNESTGQEGGEEKGNPVDPNQ